MNQDAGNRTVLWDCHQDVFKPKEHEPSYIHALYGEYLGEFYIRTMEMIQGDLPKKAQDMVREWLSMHQDELQSMWDHQQIHKLPPLL